MTTSCLFHISLVIVFSQQTIVNSLPRSSLTKGELEKYDRSSPTDRYEWSGVCREFTRLPVDLRPEDAEAVSYGQIIFDNYDSEGPIVMENNEYTGTVKGFHTWDHPPSITGGNLNESYFLRQINFRWTNEHTFNGVDFPAEVHLVHISDQYDPTRKTSPFGNIAVVAIPILAGENEAELEELKPLYEEKNVKERRFSSYSGTRDIVLFSPRVLLPWNTSTYYRYTGSLATPPCAEDGVIWTILLKPIVLSSGQLLALKNAHLHKNPKEVQEVRPAKLMNGRSGKLYLNIKGKGSISMKQKGGMNDALISNELAIAIILICAFACTFAWWEFCYHTIDGEHRMLAVPLN